VAIAYERDERGGRLFRFAGVCYRAFWLSLGHEWSVRELAEDGTPTGRHWNQRNWKAVESFMEWLAKCDGRAA
jgi:hypothetical protein